MGAPALVSRMSPSGPRLPVSAALLTFSSTAALQAYIDANGIVVGAVYRTLGFAAPSDGGGGEWFGESGGPFTPDVGTVLTRGSDPAASMAVVRDRERNTFSMAWFGSFGGDAAIDTAVYRTIVGKVNALAVAAGGTTAQFGKVDATIIMPNTGTPYILGLVGVSSETYFDNVSGLTIVGDNTQILVEPGLDFGTLTPACFLFACRHCENVQIFDIHADGNEANLIDSGLGDGAAVCFHFLQVEGAYVLNCSGRNFGTDGAFFWSRTINDDSPCKDIIFENVDLSGNNRQGASIIQADGLLFLNVTLDNQGTGVHGTGPSHGVDFEPTVGIDYVRNVELVNSRARGNVGGGLTFNENQGPIENVICSNCDVDSIRGTCDSFLFDGGTIRGYIFNITGRIKNVEMDLAILNPAFPYAIGCPGDPAPLTIEDCNIRIDATGMTLFAVLFGGSGQKVIRRTNFTFYNTLDFTASNQIAQLAGNGTVLEHCRFSNEVANGKNVGLTVSLITGNTSLEECYADGSNITFGSAGGALSYIQHSPGFVQDSSTNTTLDVSAERMELTASRNVANFGSMLPGTHVLLRAGAGATITFSGAPFCIPIQGNTLTLNPGEYAAFFCIGPARVRQIPLWMLYFGPGGAFFEYGAPFPEYVRTSSNSPTNISTWDEGGTIGFDFAAPGVINLAADSGSATIRIGGRIRLRQDGPGAATLTPAGGVTVNVAAGAGLVSPGQDLVMELEKTAANTYTLYGGIP